MNSDKAFYTLFPVDCENGPSSDDIANGELFEEFWQVNKDKVTALAEDDLDGLNTVMFDWVYENTDWSEYDQ